MSANNRIDLKAVVDESQPITTTSQLIGNALGMFHTSTDTQKSGAPSQGAVRRLPTAPIEEFLMRKTLISSGTLSTTDTPFVNLISLDAIKLFLEDAQIANKTSAYYNYRATHKAFISVVAPPGAYGKYILWAIPQGVVADAGASSIGANYHMALQTPHVIIDLSTSTDGVITLPWIHWNDYCNLRDSTEADGYTGMWFLWLTCFQPIGTGVGDDIPTASFRIWIAADSDYDLTIPYAQAFGDVQDSVNSASEQLTGMKPSGVAGAISSGAGALAAAVPFIAPLAGPVSAIAGAASSVLSWFGFTRTTAQQTPTTVVQRPYSNVANMDVNDTSEIAALSVENSISFDPLIVTNSNEDQSAFNYIFSKWTLIGVTPLTQDQSQGEVLVDFPVTPYISRVGMATGASFTAAGFVGFPFSYWRGDMEYMLYVPLSKMHRASLQISWAPVIQIGAADVTNVRFNHVIDLGTASIWKFSVAYAQGQPVLENIPHLFDAAITTTAGANGLVTISIVNPLKAQAETANTNIFIYARAKPNMDFSVPRANLLVLGDDGIVGGQRDFVTGFVLQSGVLGDDVPKECIFDLVPGVSTYPVKEVLTGEVVDSVRALCQKFSFSYTFARNLRPDVQAWTFTHFPWYPHGSQNEDMYPYEAEATPQYFTWFGYYASMFVGIAGSTRYKVINTTSQPQVVAISHAYANEGFNPSVIDVGISSVSPTWMPKPGEGVEITVPYYFKRKYIMSYRNFTALQIGNGSVDGRIDKIELPINSYISENAVQPYEGLTGYVAAGPDLRFHMYRMTPRIKTAIASVSPRFSRNWTPPGSGIVATNFS